MDEFITPAFGDDDLYIGKEFEPTPPGVYRMAVSGLSVRRAKNNNRYLSVFVTHVEDEKKRLYKGLNGTCMLEGLNKHGKPNSKAFGDFLLALGYSKEDLLSPKVSWAPLGDLDTADWKGVPIAIKIKDQVVDLIGKEILVNVVADTYNGKTQAKVKGFYRAN